MMRSGRKVKPARRSRLGGRMQDAFACRFAGRDCTATWERLSGQVFLSGGAAFPLNKMQDRLPGEVAGWPAEMNCRAAEGRFT